MSEDKSDLKYIIRIANTDLDGKKPIYHALRKIIGVDYMFANAICNTLKLDKNTLTGTLKEDIIQKIEGMLKDPLGHDFPVWLLNRRNDWYDGTDKHLVTAQLKFTKGDDLKRLQRIKSYRGLRLAWGLTVRGQRTKSNFRRQKGKGLGVKKKKGKGGRV